MKQDGTNIQVGMEYKKENNMAKARGGKKKKPTKKKSTRGGMTRK